MQYRVMTPDDYGDVYDLWLHTPGMAFRGALGFTTRDDLVYRNKNIRPLDRIDT